MGGGERAQELRHDARVGAGQPADPQVQRLRVGGGRDIGAQALHLRQDDARPLGDDRVRAPRLRQHLRHEQRRDVERMAGELEHARVAVGVAARDAEAAVLEQSPVVRVEPEVAVVLLAGL
jgi:hypothetical protein